MWVVGAAFEGKTRRFITNDQRGKHCLQNESGTSGRSYGETIIAWTHLVRLEHHFLRPECRSFHSCIANLGRRFYRGEVLP